MSESLPKSYQPKTCESKWIEYWNKHNCHEAQPNIEKTRFSLVIPPPNVTGALHMGHALVNTVQDILARWSRMKGLDVLWVPGVDHAGIATQTVVERNLMRKSGLRRTDLPRDTFLKECYKWKDEHEQTIYDQLKKMGCSCDWTKRRFTMDKGCSLAVNKTFKSLYDQGLIYRGDYLVNWDPLTQTALADDEVEYEDRQGQLWHIRYPIYNEDQSEISEDYLEIATTRPETLLGDTALAVHPSDLRYKKWIGKSVLVPLIERKIPVIADSYVDPEFGTGVVKITPAHDPNDYQVGLRHNLPMVNILTDDGHINENGGVYALLSIGQARVRVVEDLKLKGLLSKTSPHTHRVGVSYRSGAVIEPKLSKQWFVKLSEFKSLLRNMVESKEVQFLPEGNWENTYFHWIDNLRDWCISRQLWWGHRIPIWYHKHDPSRMICHEGLGVPPEVENAPDEWIQDEDVLDTWFSSALWPYSAMGWPEDEALFSIYFPNSVLVTAHDILFFWVARMLLMSKVTHSCAPFPKVFLHGLIYAKSYWTEDDKGGVHYVSQEERKAYDLGAPLKPGVKSKWEKMSKSKGNVLNPLEIMDEYGTDAMRMALTAGLGDSRQIDLDLRRFEEFRNFSNKLYNGSRFVFMNLMQDPALSANNFNEGLDRSRLSIEDRWILSLLNQTIRQVSEYLEHYQFDKAALCAYNFFWNEFCAYYLEITKPVLWKKAQSPADRRNKQKILAIVLTASLRLLHPMAPFITEELFSHLQLLLKGNTHASPHADPFTKETLQALEASCCMISPWPQCHDEFIKDPQALELFDHMRQLLLSIRQIRGDMKIPPATASSVYVQLPSEHRLTKLLSSHDYILRALVPIHELKIVEAEPQLPFLSTAVIGDITLYIPLPLELQKQEKQRLEKQIVQLGFSIEKMKAKLNNEGFRNNAPKELIEKQESNLKSLEHEYETVNQRLKKLQASVSTTTFMD